MKTEPNESAAGYGFTTANGESHVNERGLTKREHFAAIAMQNNFEQLPLSVQETICGEEAPNYVYDDLMGGIKEIRQTFGEPYIKWLLKGKSKYAVMQSDALINALNKEA